MPLLWVVLCLFFSCSKQGHWAFDQIRSEKAEFCSTKLTYRTRDPVRGIDVELLNTPEHLNVYLNIHSVPIAPSQENPSDTPLTIEVEGETICCSAYRLTGGQRFLLPDTIAQSLIKALHNHKEVTLYLTGYRVLLKPEDFTSKYNQLLHPLSLRNPFQLPF